MKITIWAGAMLAIMLTAVLSIADGTGRIAGHVFDAATNAPVAGVSVAVVGTQLATRTGSDGAYIIVNVPAGIYVVRVEKSGLPTTVQRVSVSAGQTAMLDFKLGRVTDGPATPESAARQDELKASGKDAGRAQNMQSPSPGAVGVMQKRMSACEAPAMSWQSPGFESYDTITENGWLSTLDKPLSTFSVDVDAASYGNVRRFITTGQLPPVDAVRIEELINYFDYDYPDPHGKHPFSITTEVAECPWNSEHKLVHIGLQGQRIAVENLPPTNLVFLIDVSGSMMPPNKLPLLKSSFRMLVDQLRPQDRVAIVVYAGAAGLVLPSTSGADKERILCAIDRLEAGGSTAGGAGIQLAYQVAQENFMDDGNNRVILATDGDFNVGASSDGDMERLIEEKRKSGVFLTVLGFGEGNLKDSKMETIADKGNGHYAYIDNIVEAKKVLVNEMGATLLTIAKDVKLQVEFNPARVASYRLLGYEDRLLQDRDFDDDSKDAGEIGAGHSVTALYEIESAGPRDDHGVRPLKYSDLTVHNSARYGDELLTVSFRYKQPAASESQLLAVAVRDRDTRFERASDNFRFSAAVAEFGMILRNSSEKGDATMEQVVETARAARGDDPHGYRAEFVSLAETAATLMSPTVGVR